MHLTIKPSNSDTWIKRIKRWIKEDESEYFPLPVTPNTEKLQAYGTRVAADLRSDAHVSELQMEPWSTCENRTVQG